MKRGRSYGKVAFMALLFVLASALFFNIRPIPPATEDNCVKVTATVIDIHEGRGQADIVLTLSGDDRAYYINRGMERGLSIQELHHELLNKQTDLYFVRHPSFIPQTPRHVARLSTRDELVFSEWKTENTHPYPHRQ
ncbi:MAG: hypothetical protein LPK80_11710 [Bacteroidota bacterium]|nr:hypothetical protein [Bacteroidota bacterium]